MLKYIQFTFAFGLVTALLTRVVHPLKEQGRQETREAVLIDVSAVSVAGRHIVNVGGVFKDKSSVKISQTQQQLNYQL